MNGTEVTSVYTMETQDQNMTQTQFQTCGHFVMLPLNTTDPRVVRTAIANCVLNAPTAVTAFLANTVIIMAFMRDRSLRSNANFLLAWLAITDVLVGGIVQPLHIATQVEIVLGRKRSCALNGVYDGLKFLTSMMSVMTALYISIDRCLAVTMPFKYITWVSTKRISIALVVSWLFWIAIIASWTFGAAGAILQLSCVGFMILTFILLAAIYTKMIKLAQQHRNQIASQRQAGRNRNHPDTSPDTTKHRKALWTAIYVIGTLMVCYIPIMVVVLVDIAIRLDQTTIYIAVSYTETLLLINSSLNPIIYCLRGRELRVAVLRVLGCGGASVKRRSATAAVDASRDNITGSAPRTLRTLTLDTLIRTSSLEICTKQVTRL